LLIHNRRASSSWGTKKEDKSERTVSKFAAADVMLSKKYVRLEHETPQYDITSVNPDNGDSHSDENILSLKYEYVPQP